MKININNGLINDSGTQLKSGFTGRSAVTAAGSLQTSQINNKSGVAPAGALNNTDRTTLSSTTLPAVSTLVSQAMKTPSVRQEKVSALKEAVQSGSYAIDPRQIASAIADEAGS